MHSSRMRTARLLSVSPSMHCTEGVLGPGGCVCSQRGCLLPGGVCSKGCLVWGDVCSGGSAPGRGCLLWEVSAPRGCVSLWTEWLTDRCKNIIFANLHGNKLCMEINGRPWIRVMYLLTKRKHIENRKNHGLDVEGNYYMQISGWLKIS